MRARFQEREAPRMSLKWRQILGRESVPPGYRSVRLSRFRMANRTVRYPWSCSYRFTLWTRFFRWISMKISRLRLFNTGLSLFEFLIMKRVPGRRLPPDASFYSSSDVGFKCGSIRATLAANVQHVLLAVDCAARTENVAIVFPDVHSPGTRRRCFSQRTPRTIPYMRPRPNTCIGFAFESTACAPISDASILTLG